RRAFGALPLDERAPVPLTSSPIRSYRGISRPCVSEQHRKAPRLRSDTRPTLRGVQEVLSVSNDVAAELAGVGDGVLDSFRDRLRCTILLRGKRLTIEGDEPHVSEARAVVDELVELVEGGHEIGPGTVAAVLGALDQAEDIREIFEDVVWRHRGKKIATKRGNP